MGIIARKAVIEPIVLLRRLRHLYHSLILSSGLYTPPNVYSTPYLSASHDRASAAVSKPFHELYRHVPHRIIAQIRPHADAAPAMSLHLFENFALTILASRKLPADKQLHLFS